MNRATLVGHLGNDPEIINTDGGKKIAKFSIATDDSYNNAQGERVEQTDWHNVVVYGKLAETVEKHFQKGKKYLVEGKIKTRSWDDPQGGTKRYTTEVIMSNFVFL